MTVAAMERKIILLDAIALAITIALVLAVIAGVLR